MRGPTSTRLQRCAQITLLVSAQLGIKAMNPSVEPTALMMVEIAAANVHHKVHKLRRQKRSFPSAEVLKH